MVLSGWQPGVILGLTAWGLAGLGHTRQNLKDFWWFVGTGALSAAVIFTIPVLMILLLDILH